MTTLTRSFLLLALLPSFCSLLAAQELSKPVLLTSPDGGLQIAFRLEGQGRPVFDVAFRDVALLSTALGLEFAGTGKLSDHLEIIDVQRASRDVTYAVPVGKTSSARDHHHELRISLEENTPPHRKLDIALRAFDDGIAFRYEIPQQTSLAKFVITDEQTRFSFTQNPKAKILPLRNFTTPYEWYYETKHVSEISGDILAGLPMLLKHSEGAWMALTEANLTDYAGMYLVHSEAHPNSLRVNLSPLPSESAPQGMPPSAAKVVGKSPFTSPWRVLMVADDPGRLIESNIIFNLNEPSKIADTSWIQPGKTTFPWWNHYVLEGVDFKPGVNTATMKHYIDFCASQAIPYHSLDGLDIAWYGGPIHPTGPTDVTTAAPSIDLPELLRYAKQKGVRLRLWMHWQALKPQLDEAFAAYEQWGIEGVMIDFMDRDDQEMVHWYHEVAEKAARHHLTVTWHGAYKPTGMERTWPNVLTYEAVLNQEYNKWEPPGVKGTPPAHNLDVAFVRMLAGPLDYHQGGMRNVLPENYTFRDVAPPVQGTRGHQLAMYIVYQNHLPMMADFPAAYHGQPELEFLVEVPATWDETRVLYAKIDECLVIARRKDDRWYVGGMTAGQPQKLSLPLAFLGEGSFAAELWLDDAAAGPTALSLRQQQLSNADELQVVIPPSGGFVGRLVKAKP